MTGVADAPMALGLDVVGPADAELVAGAAAGGEFAGVDPVVDHADAAAQAPGGVGDAGLAVGVGIRCWDAVGVADLLDGGDAAGSSVAGGQSGGVELVGHLTGGGGGAELADQLGYGCGAALGWAGW
ncbi:MAG TPA: hypothetical protein VE645_05410 [Pseudonocardiaceae bacterium]|nr:hypothetical protein [Pseudonocardiaceae bacterium]